jgi:predicted nucleic acid-binding protein
VKSFFDTSVLVAAFLEDHIHHEPSLTTLRTADKKYACCAAHSLAEVYSVLTRMPGKYRLGGEQVMLFLETIRDRLTIVSLDSGEYYSAIGEAAAAGIVGGTIYDALVARCALKAKTETIYTWNVSHFQRLGAVVAKRVKTP